MIKKITPYLTILFLLLLTSSCSCLRWNGEQPQGLISPKKGNTLEMNYIKNQYRFINNSVANDSIIYGEETIFARKAKPEPFRLNKKERQIDINLDLDTREAWFSMNDLVGYLTMAQKHADTMGYKNLGIRIYYGSYIKEGKPKTTVFLVATYRNPNNDTIHKTLLLDSGSSQPVDLNDPEIQKNMKGIDYLNMGSSRKPPITLSTDG